MLQRHELYQIASGSCSCFVSASGVCVSELIAHDLDERAGADKGLFLQSDFLDCSYASVNEIIGKLNRVGNQQPLSSGPNFDTKYQPWL